MGEEAAGTARELQGTSCLAGVEETGPAWCHRCGDILGLCGVWGQPVLWEVGGWIGKIPSLVFKNWEPSLDLEQKDSAILCAFKAWVPSAEEPSLTSL